MTKLDDGVGSGRDIPPAAESMHLISALIAALDGPDPEACLDAALAVLRESGVVQRHTGADPWLVLQRGSRKLALTTTDGVESPDAPTRALVGQLLGSALARLAERDELRLLRERFELLSSASFEGIMIHDGGVVVETNQRSRELLGYGPDEPLPADLMWQRVAPEDLEEAVARIRNRVEGEFLLTIVRRDGTRFRAEFCTKQTKLGGRPLRVVALRDVTARERTAALLRESEARLRQILEATFDCVMLSRNGVIVDAGGRAHEFFGFPTEQLIGRRIVDLAAPSAREEIARRLNDQVLGAYETTAIGAQGELVPVEIVSISSTLDGEPVRMAGLRDLRAARRLEQDRRRLELELERSQRLQSLGVLAGGVAHDFNNLLVGVVGSAELLASKLEDREDRETAETIRVAGERAASLTKQMLAYAGRRELQETEPVDLTTMWQELRALLEATLSKKARLEFDIAPDCVVSGERATLMQVFMNLLTNASDALEDKPGTIHISAQHVRQPDARWDEALGATVRPGDWVLVSVRDTGVGMDPATQRRAFEPFFTTKPRGHGLGLGSCLGIVAAHGGAISIESAPRQGSTFSVLLPATVRRSRPPAPVVAKPARGCRVLVIDDEPLVRTHMRRVLERRGFGVQEAPDGRAGLAAAAQTEADLIVLDLSMPDLDGVEVVRRLRAGGSRVPVVLCSGDLEYANERGLEPGMVQTILQKPFTTEELMQAIERARG